MKFLNQIDGADKLITDSLHRLVTDEDKERWNNNSGGSISMATKEAVYNLTTTKAVIPINIAEYNPSKHTLFVIKNTTTLANNVDYTISADGLTITNISGNWVGTEDVPIRFHFIAQMTAQLQPDLVATAILNNTYTAAQDNITNIPIGINEYNYLSDYLFVYQGEIRLIEGIHYTLYSDKVSISLLEYSLKTGDIVYFEVLKSTQKNLDLSDGTLIRAGTIPETALAEPVRNKLGGIIVDGVTGIKYKLIIENGALGIQEVE